MYNKPLDIEVKKIGEVKTMYVNGAGQSAIDLSNPDNYVFEYMKYFFFPLLLTEVKTALFIGGGGFTGPRLFASRGILVDAVEIDQKIVTLAKEQFAINSDRINIFVDDGRKYLENCEKKYDLIVVDVFVGVKTPIQFQDASFFALAASKLNPNGVFFSNNITSPGTRFFTDLYTTLSESFGCIYAFDNDPPSPQSRNILLVAMNNAPIPVSELLVRNEKLKNAKPSIDFTVELSENLFASD